MRRKFSLNDRLTDEQISKFKLFEGEKMIFACREHRLLLFLRLLGQVIVGLVVACGFMMIFYIFFHSISLAIGSFFLVTLLTWSLNVRALIHWCFHIYIATNKQVIEVHYSPLFSHEINSVLLDQIRCTEIDVEMHGLIPEMIGIGNVEITFDRPTHKDEFVIRGIRSPRAIAKLFSAQIHQV